MTDSGTYRRNYFGFKPLVPPQPHICVLTTNYALAELARDIWLYEVENHFNPSPTKWRLQLRHVGNDVGIYDEDDNTWAIVDWKLLQVVGWTYKGNAEWSGPWLGEEGGA